MQGFDEGGRQAQGQRTDTTGNGPDSNEEAPPIFAVARVQYSLPAALTHLCCSNNVLLLAVASKPLPRLIAIDLDQPDEEQIFDVFPSNSQSLSPPLIHKLFLDPTAKHILIATSLGDTYYIYRGWTPQANTGRLRARPLQRFKGLTVDAVAWSPGAYTLNQSLASSTREILIGTNDGRIYETWLDGEIEASFRPIGRSSHDRYMRPVISVPDKEAVRGIEYYSWQLKTGGNSKQRRLAVFVTTASRILQYVAGAGTEDALFEVLGQSYKDALPKSMDLPARPISGLHLWRARENKNGMPSSLAWLTDPGIYHGQLKFSSQEAGDGVVDSAHLVPFPPKEGDNTSPLSMALTAHHFILLYNDSVRITRILDDRLVFDEQIELEPNTKVLGIVADPIRHTYWIQTDRAIYELSVNNEERDIWSVYLRKNAFDTALSYAKAPKDKDAISMAKADALFRDAKYMQAADLYAQTTKSLEEVVLKLVETGERDSLRQYLSVRLSRLAKNDLTQRMMLATWLLESFLAKVNHLEDVMHSEADAELVENLRIESSMVEADLRDFLARYKDNLDRAIVYDLTESHGQPEIMLSYAELIGDYSKRIDYFLQEERFEEAIDCLSRQSDLDLYYRHVSVFIRYAPTQTVQAFTKRQDLDVAKVLPGLLTAVAISTEISSHVCRYLRHAVFQFDIIDTIAHNALIALYAASPMDETELLQFIATAPEDPLIGRPYYDLDYALRVCRTHHRLQACVQLYSKLEMPESAVALALELGDLELARSSADRVVDDGDVFLKRKLWLQIARHVVSNNKDIKSAMRFLEGADVLKVEDILPFFPDFVVIDDFKDEICAALESYSDQIERLKEEMREATANADLIKKDISDLSSRLIVVDAGDKCTTCYQPLLSRQFYIFPCQHGFHADCLINEVTQHVSPAILRRILDLQNQLSRLSLPQTSTPNAENENSDSNALSAMVNALGLKPIAKSKLTTASLQSMDQLRKLVVPDALVSVIGAGAEGLMAGVKLGNKSSPGLDSSVDQTAEKLQQVRQELDEILAASCVLCDRSLALIDRPFVADGEDEM